MSSLVISIFSIHFVLFVVSSLFIYKSRFPSPQQKKWQLVFSLLVPLLGPGVVLAVHLSEILKPESKEERAFREEGAKTNTPSQYTNGQGF